MTVDRPGQKAGRRWPAEWEPHEGTAFTWPRNPDTWHQGLAAPRAALAEAMRALATGEHIHVHCADGDQGAQLADALALRDDQLTIHSVPSDDAWCRDHGAIIVREADGRRTALDFGYNAWGGKYPPWDNDGLVAGHMAAYLDIARQRIDVVLEGGAIEGNGQGLLLTTASCVLNPNRNANADRVRMETAFAQWFGARHVLWLSGDIPGDDTDGHIDNIARFAGPGCALLVAPDAPRADVERELAANVDRLEEQCAERGEHLDIRRLPLPGSFIAQEQLPASYANFYVGNEVVLAPVFADPSDDAALQVIEHAFPGRRVVPIDARALVVGLGTLHCLTQQLPAP